MNRILLAFCILLLPISTSASPRFGIEVGMGSIWLSDALEFVGRKPSWRLDVSGAATARMELSGNWSLATGLRYSRLGNEFKLASFETPSDPANAGKPATVTNLHQYLGVPLILQWDVPGDAVYLLGGTELAYLVKAESDLEYDDGSADNERAVYTEDMNRFNMTLIGGMGKAFDVGSHELEVAVRYAHGLVQSNDNELSLGWKTRELSLTLGFRF